MIIVVYALLAIGLLFHIPGVFALHRFPDVYTRLHGATKCTTFGSISIYLAIIAYGIILVLEGQPQFGVLSIHTLVAMTFLLVTNPTGAHAIARSAYRSGVKPKYAIVDDLKGALK